MQNIFDEALDNVRRASESSLKMQQDFLKQWTNFWPGLPSPQTIWVEKLQDFQKQWANTISDLAKRHRQTLDRQHQALLESLEEGLRAAESSDPVEFRMRSEQLCRKTLDCFREVSETQLREFHDALKKWADLVTKAGT